MGRKKPAARRLHKAGRARGAGLGLSLALLAGFAGAEPAPPPPTPAVQAARPSPPETAAQAAPSRKPAAAAKPAPSRPSAAAPKAAAPSRQAGPAKPAAAPRRSASPPLRPAPAGVGPRLAQATATATATTTLSAVAGVPAALGPQLVEARAAWGRRDGARLAALREAALASGHPLAIWIDYWELNLRLSEVGQEALDAFYARWPGSYLEDRLRNDWLLELGRREDWAGFKREHPRFVLDDDRQVHCHAALVRHLDGAKDGLDEARRLWWGQKDADTACHRLARTLHEAGVLGEDAVWHKLRLATEANRRGAALQAAGLLKVEDSVAAIFDNPARHLAKEAHARDASAQQLAALALIRLGARDLDAALKAQRERWGEALARPIAGWVWGSLGKQAALRLDEDAPEHFQRAQLLGHGPYGLGEDSLAWKARAALRAQAGAGRWQQVLQALQELPPAEQAEPGWVYWKARALRAIAPASQDSAGLDAEAKRLLEGIASPLSFHGKLALEALGRPALLPPAPPPLTPAERAEAAARPGLQRGLALIELGLRPEGVREWNYSIRGLDDRALLAAAQMACDREIWDRCINTSERTREQVDMRQRFPMPFRDEVLARAAERGLDPAYVYGLIRQESRFILDARSHVGASGLMQLMPATAKWTARKLGLDLRPEQVTDRSMNLSLGTGYLKLVLDGFDGSQALAAAGYNAGPSRPRRWRQGPTLDAAVWAENIPFHETRDYVRRVLSNASAYAALLNGGKALTLRERLGQQIGPRAQADSRAETELP